MTDVQFELGAAPLNTNLCLSHLSPLLCIFFKLEKNSINRAHLYNTSRCGLPDSANEEHWLLRNDGYLAPQVIQTNLCDIDPVNDN